MPFIEFKKVSKNFEKVKVLKNVSFEINEKEIVIIKGSHNSGKTTILNLLSKMDFLTSGQIIVNNKSLNNLNNLETINYRKNDIAFIFQEHNLIEDLNVIENVNITAKLVKNENNTLAIMKKLSLIKNSLLYPFDLNDEEKTKVSIARALVKKPKILLCDDIINNLKEKSLKQFLKLIDTSVKKDKTTIIIVTNNKKLYPIANKIITLKDGGISNIKINKNPKKGASIC